MLQKIYTNTSKQKVKLYSIIFLFFMLLVLPVMTIVTSSLIGSSDSPDILIGGTIDEYVALREAYGSNGRRIYIILRYTFDIIWPIAYTLFFINALSYLDRNRIKKYTKYILLLPLIGVFFDLCENILATIFMATYPTINTFLIHSLYYASFIKWIFMLFSLFAVLSMLIQYIFFREKFYVTE